MRHANMKECSQARMLQAWGLALVGLTWLGNILECSNTRIFKAWADCAGWLAAWLAGLAGLADRIGLGGLGLENWVWISQTRCSYEEVVGLVLPCSVARGLAAGCLLVSCWPWAGWQAG